MAEVSSRVVEAEGRSRDVVTLLKSVQDHVGSVDKGRRRLEDDTRAQGDALRDLAARLQVCGCVGAGLAVGLGVGVG